ncbi:MULTISPECIES: cysteine desulfurase family protein [Pseudarthrobacter]|uniref:cysteine desulfurase n=1 Tax=Pseudarthrobacter oxydans TaxID=1671 RepID=A0AAW8N668_PSEOX|nr:MULTISPECIES: cysteine desulfurase family protein [Pseudarthrobacter]MBD1590868.1 cysteine desulfurase [Arthrobacter sp. S1_S22]MDV2977322.1 cysteine desulfurase family protein [Actinomycetes bacterium ARC8]MDR6792424.1 cysteine desulfurase [Pseudarthrobacter oxydans]MDR7162155.1 cysteine desulfurase [Pseudarthrobacter oxydans]GKV71651.1 cysteine desulfurase [Pseudarthrobacter sp. NCCP-2145]
MPVYLDHAATTPLAPEALAALTRELARTGNPSSLHGSGRRARRAVEDAREAVAAAAGGHPSEVIFTSGGTEADNLAVKGLYWSRVADAPARRRILCSAVEHHAVLDTVEWLERHEGAEVAWLPVDSDGVVDLAVLDAELSRDPATIALVTVMWANNEVGTIQPISRIVELAHAAGVPVHSDAVQAFGSLPVDFKASGLDAMSISGHKIGGPVGVGALLLGRAVKLTPVQHGGGQERDVRSGTLDTASIAAFAAAAEKAAATLGTESTRIAGLRDRLIDGVLERVPEAVLRGAAGNGRLPGNAHFTFPGCEGDSLLFLLDLAGVESSTGSACTAGVPRPSHVLLAMGLDEETARGAQRFTLGHASVEGDVDALLAALPDAYGRARQAGMAGHESSIQTAGTLARRAANGG